MRERDFLSMKHYFPFRIVLNEKNRFIFTHLTLLDFDRNNEKNCTLIKTYFAVGLSQPAVGNSGSLNRLQFSISHIFILTTKPIITEFVD